jgi:hypothetical protein
MKPAASPKRLLRGILSGTYTPLDLREFAQLCYTLALPLIRRKIAVGKLSLDSVGLKEPDVVYDCLADLFRRDEKGGFPQIRTYFDHQIDRFEDSSDEELITSLRGLVFGKVGNNTVRIYSEIDPSLGRILRNLKLAVERAQLFEQMTRFGEVYLLPRNADAHFELPPIPFEVLQRDLSRIVLIHDNIPQMVKKLHAAVIGQKQFQRAVPIVSAALLFKEIYRLGWQTEEVGREPFEEAQEVDVVVKIAEKVCGTLRDEMHSTYVGKGKRTEEEFERYILAVRGILVNTFSDGEPDRASYFDSLRREFPRLTKESYKRKHQSVLEYLGKLAKERMRDEMKKA